jgi:amiloride-sensitive sodium channel
MSVSKKALDFEHSKIFNFSRNCYLPNERPLKFLKVYNKVNCEHECLAEMTLESCRCVQFFMVRDKTTRICGGREEYCYRNVEDSFDKIKSECKCYENCDNIKYEIKVVFTKKTERNIL